MTSQVTVIRGVVRSLEGEEAIIEVAEGGCGRCHEKGGCGGQHLTQMFCSGPKHYHLDDPGGLAVGQSVEIAIAQGAVRRSANLAYGLPLLGLIAGAALGMSMAGDLGAMVGSGTGLLLAWWLIRQNVNAGTGNTAIRPHIISRPHF